MNRISDNLSLTGQIGPDDISEIKAQGFKSVICNRPDGEGGAEQPTFDSVAAAASAAGMEARYIPVTGGSMTEDDAREFKAALAEMPAPILAYCRSGARCGVLLQMAESLPD